MTGGFSAYCPKEMYGKLYLKYNVEVMASIKNKYLHAIFQILTHISNHKIQNFDHILLQTNVMATNRADNVPWKY